MSKQQQRTTTTTTTKAATEAEAKTKESERVIFLSACWNELWEKKSTKEKEKTAEDEDNRREEDSNNRRRRRKRRARLHQLASYAFRPMYLRVCVLGLLVSKVVCLGSLCLRLFFVSGWLFKDVFLDLFLMVILMRMETPNAVRCGRFQYLQHWNVMSEWISY